MATATMKDASPKADDDRLRRQAHSLLDEVLDKAAREKLHGEALSGLRLTNGVPQLPVYEIRGTVKPQ